jgi:NADP-dependent 3-hydroxy acid dehydrogenase YdfG
MQHDDRSVTDVACHPCDEVNGRRKHHQRGVGVGHQRLSGGERLWCQQGGLRHFSKIAAIECADARTGIRVNVVTPGGVKTPMWESMEFFRNLVSQHGGIEQAFEAMAGTSPSNQFTSPEDIARTILYLASDESAHLTGVELVIAQGHVG